MKLCDLLQKSLFVLILLNLVGCYFSFHSNQYNLLQNAVKTVLDENASGPSSNWLVVWEDHEFRALPVLIGEDVWFFSDDEKEVVIKFDGWQITSVENLLPANVDMSISMQDGNQTFTVGPTVWQIVKCDTWSYVETIKNGGGKYNQVCRNDSLEFNNMIRLNDQGGIVELEFVFHPGYSPLKMAMEFDLPPL